MFVWHSEKDMSRNYKGVIHCPLMFSVIEIVEGSLHTCVFSCPIKRCTPCVIDWEGRRGTEEEEERK